MKALVIMIVRHLHTVHELRSVLAQPTAEMQTYSPRFTSDVHEVFDFKKSVEWRKSVGGTAPASVKQQIERAKLCLVSAVG